MTEKDPGLEEIIRKIAHDSDVSEAIVERALTDLMARGHLRIISRESGAAPVLEFVFKAGTR